MKEINGHTMAIVPEGSYEFRLTSAGLEYRISEGSWQVDTRLPKGYLIVGLAKDLNVEQYEDVIEYVQANNLNPSTTLILKKIL